MKKKETFIIQGENHLKGEIEVKGSKNTALKVFIASLLSDEEWTISNVPEINDISREIEMLKSLGVKIQKTNNSSYKIQAKNIRKIEPNFDLACKIRTSIILAGPMLARFGEVKLPFPGGCIIGKRPIDLFLDGLIALGAKFEETKTGFWLKTKGLKANTFVFPQISVTATECLIMAATLAKGKTILKNAAMEPEIVSLVEFLNHCGAKIKGVGTPTIEIEGVEKLFGGNYITIPDRIETGTFAILAAATKSQIKITNCIPQHLEVVWYFLKKIGIDFELGENYVLIKPVKYLKPVNVITHEYPGFPTDLQSPLTVLLTQANGLSIIKEMIFEGRLFYTDILNQMGANIIMGNPQQIIVQGPCILYGRRIISPDIRAGISLVIAALIARGESIIENIDQIDRGYEKIEERLQKLGAKIKRV